METLLVFDVDGTLTGPRRRMHEDFSRFFKSVCRNYKVFLVSGSDLPKLEEQLPEEVLKLVSGVFPCSGNEFMMNGNPVYRMEHHFPSDIVKFLETQVEQSPYPVRSGKHVEFRTGSLNVSVVGRNASPKQRSDYFKYDNREGERVRLIEALVREFPDYEANIGGQISVDISPRGWNKSRVLAELNERFPGQPIAFFGDNMHIGGNDRPLGDAIRNSSAENQVFSVEDHYDTWKILQEQFCPSSQIRSQVA